MAEEELLDSNPTSSGDGGGGDGEGNRRMMLNVGGKLFETTVSTIRSGGPDSLLTALSSRSSPVFIDRDPEVFSVLLSLLRSGRLPSSAARRFSNQELAQEALYYGIESHLRSALSPPPFSGIDASLVSTVRPAADALPSSFTAAADGSVWIAHGGQISAYDWNLTHAGTIRTHLEHLSSIRRVWSEAAAVGSDSSAGIHLYDISGGKHLGSAHWTDPSDPRIYKAKATAIADSSDSIFASFECHHRENCVLTIDKTTLQISSELGRQSGTSTKTTVPSKLTFLPATGILAGSAVTSGAFGYAGYIRLWDPRSGDAVWETIEPGSGRSSRYGDSFADVDVSVSGSTLFKVCSKSGDVAGADLRKLGEDPWVYFKEKNPRLRNTGGSGNFVIRCYEEQVFVGRDGGLEVWSRVEEKQERESADGDERGRGMFLCEGSYRRNYVDKMDDCDRGIIRTIEGGGNRLFVSREDVEGIEVWETSNQSGVVSVLL